MIFRKQLPIFGGDKKRKEGHTLGKVGKVKSVKELRRAGI